METGSVSSSVIIVFLTESIIPLSDSTVRRSKPSLEETESILIALIVITPVS
jgi:hypothetical protein